MIEQLKKDLDSIKKNIGVLGDVVSEGLGERDFDMSYEMEKMKYECGFNFKNTIKILLILSFLFSQCVLVFAIYKYFEFEKQNTQKYMEIVNTSDNNSLLFNSINKSEK